MTAAKSTRPEPSGRPAPITGLMLRVPGAANTSPKAKWIWRIWRTYSRRSARRRAPARGARVSGAGMMTIPKGSDTGAQLRLRGKGIQRSKNPGDQYITLKLVIGHSGDPELAEFLEKWAPRHPFDPRQGMTSP